MNPKERKSDIHKASERTFIIFQHRCKQFALSIVQGADVPQLMKIPGVHLILKRQHDNGASRYREVRAVRAFAALRDDGFRVNLRKSTKVQRQL